MTDKEYNELLQIFAEAYLEEDEFYKEMLQEIEADNYIKEDYEEP